MHVNAHSGCDAWDEGGDALRFFEGGLALQVRWCKARAWGTLRIFDKRPRMYKQARALPTTGPRVSHETHRGRPLGRWWDDWMLDH